MAIDHLPRRKHGLLVRIVEVRENGGKIIAVGTTSVRTLETVLERTPCKAVEHAVKGMLPHNKLGSACYRKLYVYAGEDYKQVAQKPEVYEVK